MFIVMAAAAWASGSVLLTESRFNVQEKASFEWIYTVGEEGLSPGDELRVHDPVFHGMRWSKWGDLSPWSELCTEQSTGQRASWGLVSAYATRGDEPLGEVGVERSNCTEDAHGNPSCSADIHLDAWTSLYLQGDTSLVEGDEVHLVVGDVDGCLDRCEAAAEGDCDYCQNCGFEMPDRAFPQITWPADLCTDGGGCAALDPPVIEVSADPLVRTVLVTVPSQAVVDEPFAVKVALLDPYGNAVESAPRTLTLDLDGASGAGDGQTWTLSPGDGGWHDFSVSLSEPGVARLVVDAGGDQSGTSNPVEVFAEAPETSIFWGDIHVHHGLDWVDEDGFDQNLNHVYARDVVGIDIVAESEKAAGIELNEDALWSQLEDDCVKYTVDGEYLALLGFEWIGDIAARAYGTETEGHHNVYYDSCEAPYGTLDVDVIDSVDGEHGLWPWLDQVRDETGVDAVTIPHALRFTGHNFDVSYPGTQTIAEIYSEWGDSSVFPEGDDAGSTQDLLNHGLRLGWIGSSDNHDGWMGNPYSKYSKPSGLGAYIAPALTRADIFAALKNRHTYATTGFRPIIHFDVTDGEASLPQGSEYVADSPQLSWAIHGTAPISTLTLYGIEVGIGDQQIFVAENPDALDIAGSFGPEWDGHTEMAWWVQIEQSDGEKAWSSPIWLTDDCDRMAVGALDPLGRCGPTDTAGDTGDSGGPGEPEADSGDDTGQGDTPALRCGCAGGEGAAVLLLLPGLLALRRRR